MITNAYSRLYIAIQTLNKIEICQYLFASVSILIIFVALKFK